MYPIDRELDNWYTSAHPSSHFKNRLLVARSTETGRKTLLNRELKTRGASGSATSRRLETDAELLEALRDEFDLDFPVGTRFDCPGLDS
jgi:N-hydroxyarylamine O-acetyltransferase